MLHQKEDGMYIIFEHDQRGITSGQFVAWYSDDELLGSGLYHSYIFKITNT